jgi:serine/threonine protein kinase/Flp pilus assembly protein TadD
MTSAQLQTVKEMFHRALDCDPAERSAFLDNTCGDDAVLRREVEELLASHQEATDFIESPLVAIATRIVQDTETDLLIGQMIGHYKVVKRIGAGGMGEVYLASDITVGRSAALKVLPPRLTNNGERLRRFQQEARTVAALNHPNILTIYEVGADDSSRYIASELIEGETLRQRLARGRIEIVEATEIAIQVASALAAAHSAGVVHRDVKPDNIMLRPDGYVKVLDFGIAKLGESAFAEAAADGAGSTTLAETNLGLILGTVRYMSPEQARGERTDKRTDIWSLGVVLYEMTTGDAPFTGDTPQDVMTAILTTEPSPLGSSVAQAPNELNHIVSKALRKNPDERYQNASEMLEALKALHHRLQITAEQQLSAAEHPWLHWIRSPISMALAVLAGALGLALPLYWLRKPTTTEIPEKSIAVLPFEYLSSDKTDSYLAEGIQEEILIRLSRIADLKVISRASTERYKDVQSRDVRRIAQQLGVAHLLEGSVEKAGDQMRVNVGLIDARNDSNLWADKYDHKLTDIFAVETDIAAKIAATLQARLTGAEQRAIASRPTENTEAHQMYLKGVYYWSKSLIPVIEKSRDYFERAIELDPNYAQAYAGLADDYGFAAANGLLPPAEGWPKAQAAAEKALQLDGTLAEPYNTLAAIRLYRDRDWAAAELAFHRGIELDPNFSEIHIHHAMCLVLFGRNNDALKEITRAVELDPVSLRFNAGWGKILFFLRQYDRAIEQFQKTLELDSNYPLAHKWLGYAYEKRGMLKEAIAEWSKALALTGEDASILDGAYASSGFEGAVRVLAQRQIDRFKEKMARGQYIAAEDFVTAYMRLGDKEQAFAWLSKAIEERNRFAFEVRIDPIFDPLRRDPRFEKIVASVAPNGN